MAANRLLKRRLTNLPTDFSGVAANFSTALPAITIPAMPGKRLAGILISATATMSAAIGAVGTLQADAWYNMISSIRVSGKDPVRVGTPSTRTIVDVAGAELAKYNALVDGRPADTNVDFGLTVAANNAVHKINYFVPFERANIPENLRQVHALPLDAFTDQSVLLEITTGASTSASAIGIYTGGTFPVLLAGALGFKIEVVTVWRDAPYARDSAEFFYERTELKNSTFKPLATGEFNLRLPDAGTLNLVLVSTFASDAHGTYANPNTANTDLVRILQNDTEISALTVATWREQGLKNFTQQQTTAQNPWKVTNGPLVFNFGTDDDFGDWILPGALVPANNTRLVLGNAASVTAPIKVTCDKFLGQF